MPASEPLFSPSLLNSPERRRMTPRGDLCVISAIECRGKQHHSFHSQNLEHLRQVLDKVISQVDMWVSPS
jgi:hypothetical protein